ncbi:MAG: hypothetical protein LC721_01455 [Actinobacteria bacterium]|nr:hypothetical protein [Actinomycetota bacterium]
MTTSETMTEVTRRSQEAFASAVQIWADSLQRFVGLLPASDATVPSADEVVDRAYDFAAQALATQREFTKSILAASRSAASSAAWVAQDATTRVAANAKSAAS